MGSTSPAPSGYGGSGQGPWPAIAAILGLLAAALLLLVVLMSSRGRLVLGGAAATSTVKVTTTAAWITTTVTATGPAAAPATTAAGPAIARATTVSVPARTDTVVSRTPPPTPVGRGPDLGGGSSSPDGPDAALVVAGIGLLAAAGIFGTGAVRLSRRRPTAGRRG